MRQTLKRLTRMTIGYGMVQWAGPFLSLVFTPILTRILTPSDYGIGEYVLTVASAVSTVALLGIPQALTVHFNDRPEDAEWQRRIVGSSLSLVMAVGLPVSLALFVLAPKIALWALQDTRYTFLFQIIGATTLFGLANTVLMAGAQAALRVRWGMLFSLTTLVATVVGNILFIIVLRLGVTGLVLVPVATGICISVVSEVVMRRVIGKPSLDVMKLVLLSGLVLAPVGVAGWALQVVDRLFLIHYVSTDALGYYAIANRIAGLLFVVLSPVYTAWAPLALSMRHHPDARQRYADMGRYLIAAALVAALGLGLFATEILVVLTRPAYLPAAPYVGFLTYVHVFSAFGTVLSTGAMAGKQIKQLSGAVVSGALVNLALNFVLIPRYGIWGATAATMIGYAVPQIILYGVVQRRYPIPYATGRLIAATLVQACLLLVGMLVPPMWFPIRVGLKLIIFAVLPVALVALNVITRFELSQAGLFLRNQLKTRFLTAVG